METLKPNQLWFERPLRTRGYECDPSRAIPLPVFLEYLENLRWECLLDPQFGLVDSIRGGSFFVVWEQRVEIVERIGMGVDLTLKMGFEHVGRSLARVQHEVRRCEDDALVARARVAGAFLGPNRRPRRIPDALRAAAQALMPASFTPPSADATAREPAPSVSETACSWFEPEAGRHVPTLLDQELPKTAPSQVSWVREIVLRPCDDDIFSHVNAATYLRIFEDTRLLAAAAGAYGAASEGAGARSCRVAIAHPREARSGDRVNILTWVDEDSPRTFGFALMNPDEVDPICLARVTVE